MSHAAREFGGQSNPDHARREVLAIREDSTEHECREARVAIDVNALPFRPVAQSHLSLARSICSSPVSARASAALVAMFCAATRRL